MYRQAPTLVSPRASSPPDSVKLPMCPTHSGMCDRPRTRDLAGGFRRKASVVLATFGLAVVSACGGQATPQSAPTLMPGQSADELVSQAKTEGQVDWYTVFTDANSAPIIEAFNKDYPEIKVSTLRLSAAQLSSRIATEQRGGQYSADVVSLNATNMGQLRQAGNLQPYDPPDLPALPEGLSLPEGFQGVAYINSTVIAYNPSLLQRKGLQPPTSWEDLTRPEWKGQFSIDPDAVGWYDSLIAGMGHEKALALVTALGKNSPRLTPNRTQQLTEMQAGEVIVAATAYGPASAVFAKKDPTRTAFVNPKPLPAVLTLSSLAKDAPHPAAAKLFLGWLLSKDGQTAIVENAGKISIRNDVQNNTAIWDPKEWPPAWADMNSAPEAYNKMVDEFTEAMQPNR